MTTALRRLRVLVHALDRTGPPVLALAHLRWCAAHRPEVDLDVVAFRGGPLLPDFAAVAPTVVVLDDHEPWEHDAPVAGRRADLVARLADLPRVDATLAVSVSAGQVLPLLPSTSGPRVTWAVEVGDDLHWIDRPALDLVGRTARWLAGSEATRSELLERLPAGTDVAIVPEFVERPAPTSDAERAQARVALGADADDLLVLGAGIGTWRKGSDLFVEVAAALGRTAPGLVRAVWIGGEADPLHDRVAADAEALPGVRAEVRRSVADLDPLLAAADVFVHAARADAFPLVCLHASLAGTPVVAFSGTGGVDEMFGAASRNVPFPDVTALADEVLALRDPAMAQAAGGEQAAHVAQRYVADVAASVLHQAVAEAVA